MTKQPIINDGKSRPHLSVEEQETLLALLHEGQRQLYWNHGDEDLDLGVMGIYPRKGSKEWMDACDEFWVGLTKAHGTTWHS